MREKLRAVPPAACAGAVPETLVPASPAMIRPAPRIGRTGRRMALRLMVSLPWWCGEPYCEPQAADSPRHLLNGAGGDFLHEGLAGGAAALGTEMGPASGGAR